MFIAMKYQPSQRPLRLLIVIQDCRYQNLNQRKENEQRARKNEGIEARHVREPRQLAINGKAIGNKCEHRGNGDTDLRAGVERINPENGPRHNYNQNEGKDHFQNVVLHVARGGEFEDVSGIRHARREHEF